MALNAVSLTETNDIAAEKACVSRVRIHQSFSKHSLSISPRFTGKFECNTTSELHPSAAKYRKNLENKIKNVLKNGW